ncbi:MAG: FAD-binding protein, partial [Lachnospiraceae bacterium]|nr:FAD-binding protein [Lachnospiraceae bacterium]
MEERYGNTESLAAGELDIPLMQAPEVTDYCCDVLVIGCGWAGLNAAYAARKTGADVLVVDKGTPGYSGLSSFSSSHQWYDPEMGDDLQACLDEMVMANEYLANIGWYKEWAKHSKQTYQRLMDWGLLTQYPTGCESGHWVDGDWRHDDLTGYHEEFLYADRRARWTEVLTENGIPYVSQTMIYDVIEDDNRIVGAVGFHVPTATVIRFSAKAVVMCMGGGSIKPAGFPTSCDTFDSDWIGYQHGLPIVGKEFDDFHFSASFAPDNVLTCNSWTYLENIWLTGGDISRETLLGRAQGEAQNLILPRIESVTKGLADYHRTDVQPSSGRGKSRSGKFEDPRKGKWTSDLPKGDTYGAAVGMQLHLGCGIFCGLDDLEGKTALEGLWVAGDGCNGSCVSGGSYLAATGFTSNFCSTQGYLAGEAAGTFIRGRERSEIKEEVWKHYQEEILEPLGKEKGFNPSWACDQLHAIMSPGWVTIVKTEESLTHTLGLVENFQREVLPLLRARNAHELRLCHEMQHKTLCAQMKLRASLERKESRGYHYRADYPYRDDAY